jgi:hypothetical protein
MQRRIVSLEEENRQLRSEASQLAHDTADCEMAEQRLVQDIASQLGKLVTFCQLLYFVLCIFLVYMIMISHLSETCLPTD